MAPDVMTSLFQLIDGCRERGVMHIKLHDGTEFHLDPTHGYGLQKKTDMPPGLYQPEALSADQAPSRIERVDHLTAELDAQLFGKPL